MEQALFRVAQEALSNVARHSGARTASVRLVGGDGTVTLLITDDGRGIDIETAGHGVSLESMRERAQMVGGRFRVAAAPGGGTVVSVSLHREET